MPPLATTPDSTSLMPASRLAPPLAILSSRTTQSHGWPLVGSAATRQLEHAWAAALPPHTLMQRAGLTIARLALARWPHAQRIAVVAGPGNNGGDGVEAALHLHRAGRAVHCHIVLPEGATIDHHGWPDDAARSLERARAAGITVSLGLPDPMSTSEPPAELIIDALLGRGLSRAVEGPLADAITWIGHRASQGCAVLAVDLPSGLSADTGHVSGEPPRRAACVAADVTLSLLTLAPGMFTAQGRAQCGEIWWHDLAGTASTSLVTLTPIPGKTDAGTITPLAIHASPSLAPTPAAWLLSRALLQTLAPMRHHDQHKGSFGDVWVVGGAPGMAGAAVLAGRAALLGGAGRVYVAPVGGGSGGSGIGHADARVDQQTNAANAARPPTPMGPVDPLHPELMHGDIVTTGSTLPRWATATVVAGCGGGQAIELALPDLLAHAERLVLDADALNALAKHPEWLAPLQARRLRGLATVLTPHPLEAARLLGSTAAHVQSDRLAAASALTDHTGAVVVLKGSGSIISLPACACPSLSHDLPHTSATTRHWIAPVGSAALGTAGSGDVLAGLIGSLWGQLAAGAAGDNAPSADVLARHAAALGVYQHGDTAERLSPFGAALSASALAAGLPASGWSLGD